MFPYRDNNPLRRLPVVTYSIIFLNILAFVIEMVNPDLMAFLHNYGLVPSEVKWYTFITHAFLHIGLFHLIGNIWFLYLFGDNVEDLMGRAAFPVFYLVGAVLSGISHIWSTSGAAVDIPLIGASGAISFIMGAYFVLFPDSYVDCFMLILFRPITFKLNAKWFLLFWFVMQLFNSAMSDGARGGVAYWAHIGGFALSAGLLWIGIRTGIVAVRHRDKVRRGEWALIPEEEDFVEKLKITSRTGDSTARLVREFQLLSLKKEKLHLNPEGWYLIATVMDKEKAASLAEYAYRHLIVNYPKAKESLTARVALARLLVDRGKVKDAVPLLQWVLQGGPDDKTAVAARQQLRRINEALKADRGNR